MNTMTYKNFSARIEFDGEDGIFFGFIAGISDRISFHADNVTGLTSAFHEAVDDYIDACARVGKEPQKPYSGKLMLRISPVTHANVAKAAELSGKSITKWAEDALYKAASAD